MSLRNLAQQSEINLLVAFADLSYFSKTTSKMSDSQVATWINSFYEKLADLVELKGGLIVKFIGDAALVVFEERRAEDGILSLLEAKSKIDQWLAKDGFKSRLEVKIHFGSVVAGPYGGSSCKNFDIIGKTVNTCATLEGGPFCISPQAFRQLSAEARKHFKKHTPPITYIRAEDRHE